MNFKHRIAAVMSMAWLAVPACKTVHTELFIPAQPEEVWAVLADGAKYEEWNPVLVPVAGELREGEAVRYRMTEPNGKESMIDSKVVRMVPNEKLNQFGGVPGIITFDHTYLLEVVAGGTRVTQHEEYRGVYVPFWDASWVEGAYAKVNEALRDRVLEQRGE